VTYTGSARGPLVRLLREARGMTITALAEKVGVSIGFLSRIEREKRTAYVGLTWRIASELDVAPEELTGQLPPFRALRMIVSTLPDEEFADSIGVSPDELRRIELGRLQPDPQVVELMAERLGVLSHDLCPDLPAPATAPPST
jgi:transcriptional regulator with XRE-family HTH domain